MNADAGREAMAAALLQWTCPACGGKGSHLIYGPGARAERQHGYHNPLQQLVACRKCGGAGLDPRASAALAAAGIPAPRPLEGPLQPSSAAPATSGPQGAQASAGRPVVAPGKALPSGWAGPRPWEDKTKNGRD